MSDQPIDLDCILHDILDRRLQVLLTDSVPTNDDDLRRSHDSREFLPQELHCGVGEHASTDIQFVEVPELRQVSEPVFG
jgi:hypothetical protein